MTRTRLERLATELHGEPRKHAWRPVFVGTLQTSSKECVRGGCEWRWNVGLCQPEPTGCTGTDPED